MSVEQFVSIPFANNPEWGSSFCHKINEEWFEDELFKGLFTAGRRILANGQEPSPSALYSCLPHGLKQEYSVHDIADALGDPLISETTKDSWIATCQEWIESNLQSDFENDLFQLTEPGAEGSFAPHLSKIAGLVSKYQDLSNTDEQNSISFDVALKNTLGKMQEQAQRGTDMVGISTGFADLDRHTLGFEPGSLIIIAGRPSMGKTTLAMNICESMSLNGHRVKVHSMEMPSDQLIRRSLASLGSIPLQSLRSGRLTALESERLSKVVGKVNNMPLIIDDRAGLDIDYLCAQARLEHRVSPFSCLMVDYLQLLDSLQAKNRFEAISDISRKLKGLAKDLGIPVIALSQLSRSLEQRPDKRPILSDLRESGQIEQDADIILFAYRDEVYNPTTEDKGVGEIIIGKQRNGPLDTVRVRFEGQHTRFRDMPAAPPMPIPGNIEKPDDGNRF